MISSIEASLEKPAAWRCPPPPDARAIAETSSSSWRRGANPPGRAPPRGGSRISAAMWAPSTARRKSMIPSEYGSPRRPRRSRCGGGTRRRARRPRRPAPARAPARAASASRTGRSRRRPGTPCARPRPPRRARLRAATPSASCSRTGSAGVGDERHVERLRELRRQLEAELAEDVAQHLAGRRGVESSTRSTSPKRELSWWWSMLTV